MQKIIINCKTNDEIKYGVCVEEGLKLNNNALELELTNEELNVLTDGLVEFRNKVNGLNRISGTAYSKNCIHNQTNNPHCHHVNFPNNKILQEEVKDYIVKLINETNNELEINKILKNKVILGEIKYMTLKKLEEESKNLNDRLNKAKAFLDTFKDHLFLNYRERYHKEYLKNKLSEYGFNFDEFGYINNLQERSKTLMHYVNSLRGDTKYKEEKKIKEIEELVATYVKRYLR